MARQLRAVLLVLRSMSLPRTSTADLEPPPAQRGLARPKKHHRSADRRPVEAVCFWKGTSGRLYRFSVHSLIECPQATRGLYILAWRPSCAPKALHVGAAASHAASLNLAHIRHRGAKHGATEAHLFAFAGTTAELRRMVRDLRAATRR